MKEVEQQTEGDVKLSTGTLYGIIKRLLADEMIRECPKRPAEDFDDQRRRYYRLTDRGREIATAEAERLSEAAGPGARQTAARRMETRLTVGDSLCRKRIPFPIAPTGCCCARCHWNFAAILEMKWKRPSKSNGKQPNAKLGKPDCCGYGGKPLQACSKQRPASTSPSFIRTFATRSG